MPLCYRVSSLDRDPPAHLYFFLAFFYSRFQPWHSFLSFLISHCFPSRTSLLGPHDSIFLLPTRNYFWPQPLMPFSPEHLDASRQASTPHLYGDAGPSLAIFLALAAVGLPPTLQVAASYATTEWTDLPLSTTVLVATGTTSLHTHARLDP